MALKTQRGFTLLEMLMVIAIIGVVSAMSAATVIRIGERNATQSASNDILAALQSMRSRSLQRGSDVYVLVYPTFKKTTATTGSLTGGPGALFFYEDVDGDFLTGTGACNGTAECSWSNFNPVTGATRSALTENDRLLRTIFLDDYAGANVKFGKVNGKAWGDPFSALSATNTSGCTFCTANRGALLFTDTQLVLLNGTGGVTTGRVGGIALQGVKNPDNQFLIGLVRATGLIVTQR
ncbi:MAG: pilus assembly FimT family protein [Archangium sp.]